MLVLNNLINKLHLIIYLFIASMKIAEHQENQKVNPSSFEELFYQISPEIAETFTNEQIAAIKNGFQGREWHEHFIDKRISILIPILPFYVVLLAGEERRSKQRWKYEKSLYPFWTPGNISILFIFALMIVTGSISTLFLVKSLLPTHLNLAFPTSIPGVENQEDCERFDRTWKDNKCWDNQHSLSF
ncbi:MAG: hypothetical protein RLZZ507_1038 [Cyanobacteriota bacterium]